MNVAGNIALSFFHFISKAVSPPSCSSIKSISETDLLSKDNVSTTVKVGECDYQTDIMMKNKEVDFNIKSITESEECKKDQKWKFISTDGILVLDHRKML